jgi:hypothetical protein
MNRILPACNDGMFTHSLEDCVISGFSTGIFDCSQCSPYGALTPWRVWTGGEEEGGKKGGFFIAFEVHKILKVTLKKTGKIH